MDVAEGFYFFFNIIVAAIATGHMKRVAEIWKQYVKIEYTEISQNKLFFFLITVVKLRPIKKSVRL